MKPDYTSLQNEYVQIFRKQILYIKIKSISKFTLNFHLL